MTVTLGRAFNLGNLSSEIGRDDLSHFSAYGGTLQVHFFDTNDIDGSCFENVSIPETGEVKLRQRQLCYTA